MICAPPAPTGAGEQLKIALVSPYDYPFPGGVTEHIGFLAAGLEARGHRVSILAPSSADREQLATDHVYRLGSIVRVPYHGSLARITLSLGLRQKVRALLSTNGSTSSTCTSHYCPCCRWWCWVSRGQ